MEKPNWDFGNSNTIINNFGKIEYSQKITECKRNSFYASINVLKEKIIQKSMIL